MRSLTLSNGELRLNASLHGANASPLPRFCALAYRPDPLCQAFEDAGSVILLAVEDEQDALCLLVHPDLYQCVREEDCSYIKSLLNDIFERAKSQPNALFEQLCSLAAGPLIACEVGARLAEYPQLMKLSARFVRV